MLEQVLELALAEVEPLERVERLLVALVDLEDLAVHVERALDVALLLLDHARHHEHQRQRVVAVAELRQRRGVRVDELVPAAGLGGEPLDLGCGSPRSRGPRRAP